MNKKITWVLFRVWIPLLITSILCFIPAFHASWRVQQAVFEPGIFNFVLYATLKTREKI